MHASYHNTSMYPAKLLRWIYKENLYNIYINLFKKVGYTYVFTYVHYFELLLYFREYEIIRNYTIIVRLIYKIKYHTVCAAIFTGTCYNEKKYFCPPRRGRMAREGGRRRRRRRRRRTAIYNTNWKRSPLRTLTSEVTRMNAPSSRIAGQHRLTSPIEAAKMVVNVDKWFGYAEELQWLTSRPDCGVGPGGRPVMPVK